MSVAMVVGTAIALAVIAALVLSSGPGGSIRAARVVRWISAGLAIGIAIARFQPAYDDSGWFAIILFGVPVAASLLVLMADYAGRWAVLATWLGAVVMIVWSLLTALGAGFYLLLPSLVMLAAAVLSASQRTVAPKRN